MSPYKNSLRFGEIMPEWPWVALDAVLAIHDRRLAEHGGLAGTRDTALVESALARPRNLAAYDEPDAAELAAAYAYGLAKNHGFSDGNKRTAWVVARVFLRVNLVVLQFDPSEAVALMLGVAGGTVAEPALAGWFRERIVAE
jgi:death-on-curing protein